MSENRPRRPFNPSYIARRYGLSALLALTVAGTGIYSQIARADIAAAPAVPATPAATATAEATPEATATASPYADGVYTGDGVNASHWGTVQAKVTIKDGVISNLSVVNYPHSTSLSTRISQSVLPTLMKEVVTHQSSSVDIISGATLTSEAFAESVQSALDSARLNL